MMICSKASVIEHNFQKVSSQNKTIVLICFDGYNCTRKKALYRVSLVILCVSCSYRPLSRTERKLNKDRPT